MNDLEIFELCAKVFQLTKWGRTKQAWGYPPGSSGRSAGMPFLIENKTFQGSAHEAFISICPNYDTDYMLAQIPRFLNRMHEGAQYPNKFPFKLRASIRNNGNWRAGYYNTPRQQVLKHLVIEGAGQSPQIALLKLVIALYEEGELS